MVTEDKKCTHKIAIKWVKLPIALNYWLFHTIYVGYIWQQIALHHYMLQWSLAMRIAEEGV